MAQNTPYLDSLNSMASKHPCLKQFLDDWSEFSADNLLRESHHHTERLAVGRAGVIEFVEHHQPQYKSLDGIEDLRKYLQDAKTPAETPSPCKHRLYLLEDLSPLHVEALGASLDIDPVVFANQLNEYHFNDFKTVPQKTLPSLLDPTKSFTLKYYELRTWSGSQTGLRTFAYASRQIKGWTKVPNQITRNWGEVQVAYVRHNASFWCREVPQNRGWDAVIFLDPSLDSHQLGNRPYDCLYQTPQGPWIKVMHSSDPYHGGYYDVRPWNISHKSEAPSRKSLFDDIIFYWEHAEQHEIESALQNCVNTTTFLNRIIACHWGNLLELVLETLSHVEFMSRDEGRSVGESASPKKWAKNVQALGASWEGLTVFRARLMWFEDEMIINLERLGIAQDGKTTWSDQNGPSSLKAAKKDFYAVFLRLQLYKSRADSLTSIVTDIVNLRGAVLSFEIGRYGLKLALIGAIFLPITLVAAIFSMTENFKPGAKLFWVPWACALPLIFLTGTYLIWPIVRGGEVAYRRRSSASHS